MKDWRGTEVNVGDRVVYPGRHSSSMWMVEAEVVELVPGNPDAESYWDRTPHSLKVKRLAESGYGGKDVDPKVVPVKLDSVTVIPSIERLLDSLDLSVEVVEVEVDGRAT